MKNYKYSSYLVCNEHIEAVRDFLANFFEEVKEEYNFKNWVTFKVPNNDFVVSLMGSDVGDEEQSITQNMTFEISCNSLEQLNEFAEKYDKKVNDFVATTAPQKYRYHYVEILGPENICKIEINYIKHLD